MFDDLGGVTVTGIILVVLIFSLSTEIQLTSTTIAVFPCFTPLTLIVTFSLSICILVLSTVAILLSFVVIVILPEHNYRIYLICFIKIKIF